jgi:hypothetical protein
MKYPLAILVICGTASVAWGQPSPGYPQYGGATANPYAFGPTNPYNRTNQPLSPYLNLLRGGNPGVNYFYGVRPGTTGGGGFGGAVPMFSSGAQRVLSFPQSNPDDPLELPTPGEGYKLPPAGHPVLFNNTMGYFPSAGGQRQPARSGLTGAGGPRTAPRR